MQLYDEGTKEDGGVPTGELRLRMRWHQRNKLALQFLHLRGLRDVSQLVVADADSFHDNKITLRALSLFGVYLLVGTICYDLYFRDCADVGDDAQDTEEGIGGNRVTDSIANFTENSFDDVTNIRGNVETFGSDMVERDCERVLTMASFLDAMVFQFTSFTTVGYGTHPKNFEDNTSMVRDDGACCFQT